MKEKHKIAHMKAAFVYAECSTATRLQVGCVLVKDNRIISIGYNGMPSGWTNECEETVLWHEGKQLSQPITITKSEVLHAETNAIAKLASSHESGKDAYMFCTHSPCLECAKLIYQSGLTHVFYKRSYRNTNGIEFLKKAGVSVDKVIVPIKL